MKPLRGGASGGRSLVQWNVSTEKIMELQSPLAPILVVNLSRATVRPLPETNTVT